MNTGLSILFLVILGSLVVPFIIPALKNGLPAPFVPVNKKIARAMLDAAKLQQGEILYDLGSGSGTLLFAANRIGAISQGYELLWPLVLWTKLKVITQGKRNISVSLKNFFTADFSSTNVISIFLIPHLMPKVEQKLAESKLRPGTRIVSYAFKLPTWIPKKVVKESGIASIYIYEV